MRIKLCTNCDHKNSRFADNCEKCNACLKSMPVYKIPSPPESAIKTDPLTAYFAARVILGVLALIILLILSTLTFCALHF